MRTAEQKETLRLWMRDYRAKHPERIRAANRKASLKRGADPAFRKRKADWQKANPERRTVHGRRYHYGMTGAQFDEMFAAQGNACLVCKSTEPDGKMPWHVDHCHESGNIRGILCRHCNCALGMAKDNAYTLRALAEYLDRNRVFC